MIIKREYVTFGTLYHRDREAWNIFEKAFKESYPPEDHDRIMDELMPQCLYQRDMGWCFQKLQDIIEGFARLDEEKPYDNGFTYQDVNETEIVYCGEDGLVLHLLSRCDGIYHIVKIVEFND